MMQGENILVTGGTGSFGSAFIRYLIKNKIQPHRLVVFSRDWQKQMELRESLGNVSWIKWVIGDIRDKEKLIESMETFNTVIHSAAIKDLTTCENNPVECLKTNVIGTQNVIDACKYHMVNKAILISTDKAVNPINVYGTSKKMAEKLWISSGYNVARYGNVIGSSGSVLPVFRKLIKEGAKSLPVTDERCSRFWFPMDDAIKLVIEAMESFKRGEVFIPKMPSIMITDLCKALDMPYHVIGLRNGEKLSEDMIPFDPITGREGYNSGNNEHFLTVEQIKESIYGI